MRRTPGEGYRLGDTRMWRGVLAATIVVLGVGASAFARPAHVVAASPPGFATPVPSGIQGNGFEQDIRYDAKNDIVYTSAPASLSSTTSLIWHSTDGGQTFKEIPAQIPPAGKPVTCVGGGDSELGTDTGGHLYFNDLTVANFSTARSDDKGTTFAAAANCAGVPNPGVDRQWYATKGDPTNGGFLALAYDRIEQSQPVDCPGGSRFVNGNVLTFNLSPVAGGGATAGEAFGPPQGVQSHCDEGIMGNDEVFDYGSNGGLRAFVVHDNGIFNTVSMGRCDIVGISVPFPTGFTNCQDVLISDASVAAGGPGCPCVVGGSFPTMAVDTLGNLFAVWEQAPAAGGVRGNITGNTQLFFSTSMNQGNSWSTPAQLPTPGLLQDVFAWPGAGDFGRIDVAFYGTPQAVQCNGTTCHGPDTTSGDWGLYVVQTLNNGLTWSAPALASEHFIHRGTIQTVMGSQTGNRTLGDFLQLRIGPQGEAMVAYSDSNNLNSGTTPQPMFVRQNSGPSVFTNANGTGTVNLPAALGSNCASGDPLGANDATFDANSLVGANNPNLDLLGACMSQPDLAHYQVTMQVADLTSLTPGTGAGGATLIWQTQWHVPSMTDAHGGALFFAYMESVNGGAPTCWVGQSANEPVGGGVELTYPGTTPITGANCSYTAAAPGTITISFLQAQVNEPQPINSLLYSVTASTQTLVAGNAETPPPAPVPMTNLTSGGQLFNLIDVVPPFDFNPSAQTCLGPACNIPEVQVVSLLIVSGGAATLVGMVLRSRRRRQGSRLAG